MSNHIPIPPDDEQMARIKELHIDPVEGKIYDGVREVGHVDKESGYYRVNLCGRTFRRSHLVWWKHHGSWPATIVDHDNRIRHDDRMENLKSLTPRENSLNCDRSLDRELPPGVYWANDHKKSKHYQARIWINPDAFNLGFYDTPEEASDVVQKALEDLKTHGPSYFSPKEKIVKELPEGVRRHPPNKKNPFKSKIWLKTGEKHLGYFPTAEAASEAFQKAKRERDANSPS